MRESRLCCNRFCCVARDTPRCELPDQPRDNLFMCILESERNLDHHHIIPNSCMGGCVTKSSFTVNKDHDIRFSRLHPFLFSKSDAEQVLMTSDEGDYLLYVDHGTEKTILSVRLSSYIRHYRITELNGLYYLEGQPYAYLDSIILYHRKVKLNGAKLNKQAHLSARVVQTFAHKVAKSNGNLQRYTNKNSPVLASPSSADGLLMPTATQSGGKHSRSNSYTSLLTTSSDSTCKQQRL